jgi:hypothetical protein
MMPTNIQKCYFPTININNRVAMQTSELGETLLPINGMSGIQNVGYDTCAVF